MKKANDLRIAGLGTIASILGGLLLRRRRRGGVLGSGLIGLGLARLALGLLGRTRIRA